MTTEAIINIRHSAKEIHGDPLAKALSQWENSIRKYKSQKLENRVWCILKSLASKDCVDEHSFYCMVVSLCRLHPITAAKGQ